MLGNLRIELAEYLITSLTGIEKAAVVCLTYSGGLELPFYLLPKARPFAPWK